MPENVHLTEREQEILELLLMGLANKEIAYRLAIKAETVKWYIKQIYSKLGVTSRVQAVLKVHHGTYRRKLAVSHHTIQFPVTSFVGRKSEMAEIRSMLRGTRLLILTGLGGMGKTRLAIELAHDLQATFTNGVCFVPLAFLDEPDAVVQAVAGALGLPVDARQAAAAVRHTLRDQHLLLILDNFEHLIPAKSYILEWLEAAPQLTILLTSREKLHLYGETVYWLQPFCSSGAPHCNDAVQLFLERGKQAGYRGEFTGETLTMIAQICHHLDGIPLAIELAAGLLHYLSPAMILNQLQQRSRLSLLSQGARNVHPRQQSLSNALDWSFNLLNPDEQTLFSRMSIFENSASLQAIQHICLNDTWIDAIPALRSLVDKCLVCVQQGVDGELHYFLLDILREYAAAKIHDQYEMRQLVQRQKQYEVMFMERAKRDPVFEQCYCNNQSNPPSPSLESSSRINRKINLC